MEEKNLINENIVELAFNNTYFRKVIITGAYSQVVLMSVEPGQELGKEVHKVDQMFFFVAGKGEALVNNVVSQILPDHFVFVRAGSEHNIKSTGSEDLKLFTLYAPAQHEPRTREKTK